MLHKTRARNARPYGYGGIMRSSFFRNIVGARIARPLSKFVQNFEFAHLLFIIYIAASPCSVAITRRSCSISPLFALTKTQ